MLEVAKTKFPNLKFIQADAANTTLEDKSVDVISISYGIRNVVERVKALEEFNRILKLGGYLVVLEFAKPDKRALYQKQEIFMFQKYSQKLVDLFLKTKKLMSICLIQ